MSCDDWAFCGYVSRPVILPLRLVFPSLTSCEIFSVTGFVLRPIFSTYNASNPFLAFFGGSALFCYNAHIIVSSRGPLSYTAYSLKCALASFTFLGDGSLIYVLAAVNKDWPGALRSF